MAKNDRTTTIEHRKNNTTYNKRTKAAKPNPNLKLEKKTKKTQKESKINHVLSFFSVLVRFFPLLFHFVFFCFCLFFFNVFFHFCFRFFPRVFTCSKVSVIRSPEKGKARQNKRKKKRRKKTAKEDRQKKNEKKPTAYKCISGLPLFAFFAFIKIVVCFFSLCFCFSQKDSKSGLFFLHWFSLFCFQIP